MARSIRKWLFPGIAAAVLLAGLGYAFWPKPVLVDLAEARRAPMVVTIEDEGETRVRHVYTISAPLAGRVARFEGHVGDAVVAGETVVATIRPSESAFLDPRTQAERESAVKAAEAALDLARSEVVRVEAARDFALAEFRRVRELAARGIVAQNSLDRAEMDRRAREAELETARAQLRVREFELQTARAALLGPRAAAAADGDEACCFRVTAPVGGTILQVLQESEAVVQPGTPLLALGDPTDLEIIVEVLSTDAVLISAGDEVLIDGWGGGRSLAGRVRRVEPFARTKVSALGIEEQRVNVVVDFVDPPENWRRLAHGYRVVARIVRWRGDAVLQVPLSALFRTGARWSLFKVVAGRARLAEVEVGHMTARTAEIISGVAEGEAIVEFPSDTVEDGIRVAARAQR